MDHKTDQHGWLKHPVDSCCTIHEVSSGDTNSIKISECTDIRWLRNDDCTTVFQQRISKCARSAETQFPTKVFWQSTLKDRHPPPPLIWHVDLKHTPHWLGGTFGNCYELSHNVSLRLRVSMSLCWPTMRRSMWGNCGASCGCAGERAVTSKN